MLYGVLTFLGVFGAVLLLLAPMYGPIVEEVKRKLHDFAREDVLGKTVIVALVAAAVLYGGSKPSVHFDAGLRDNGSWVTNDTIHIAWVRDNSLMPESATVYIDYRPIGSTNEWGLLAQTIVGAYQWDGTLENACSNVYNVWAYYIPPEPVHTNGVWVYKTLKDRGGKHAIPLRARVEVDDRAISTPKQKRKDEE